MSREVSDILPTWVILAVAQLVNCKVAVHGCILCSKCIEGVIWYVAPVSMIHLNWHRSTLCTWLIKWLAIPVSWTV